VSRKNLSRTVIEGGRYFHNKLQRRRSHAVERMSTRAWLNRVADDVDDADATAPAARPPVRKLFYDKLAPAYRWLARNVGRPWNKVYAELCATFDRRTTAGRHVVDAHMLESVHRGNLASRAARHRRGFYVDRHGILRALRPSRPRPDAVVARLLAFARGRIAARTAKGWWWFRARATWSTGRWQTDYLPLNPMSNADVRRLRALPDELRGRVTTWRALQV
jgi:hypothetical protein